MGAGRSHHVLHHPRRHPRKYLGDGPGGDGDQEAATKTTRRTANTYLNLPARTPAISAPLCPERRLQHQQPQGNQPSIWAPTWCGRAFDPHQSGQGDATAALWRTDCFRPPGRECRLCPQQGRPGSYRPRAGGSASAVCRPGSRRIAPPLASRRRARWLHPG
jgi:hypothetical protein